MCMYLHGTRQNVKDERVRARPKARPTWSGSHERVRPCAPRESCTPDRSGTAPRLLFPPVGVGVAAAAAAAAAVVVATNRRDAQRKNVARPRPARVLTKAGGLASSSSSSLSANRRATSTGCLPDHEWRSKDFSLCERAMTRHRPVHFFPSLAVV